MKTKSTLCAFAVALMSLLLVGAEKAERNFFLDRACTVADQVVDEQAMWVETRSGLVVLVGCAHAGIVNTLFYGDNCHMVYGDAQAVLVQMIEAVRGLGLPAAA